MAFGNMWLGVRSVFTLSGVDDTNIDIFSLDNIHVIDGVSRIDRILVRYGLHTALMENTEIGSKDMRPTGFRVSFSPSPDGEFGQVAAGLGGDALWRETVQWQPQYFTDGALFSTKWWARPENTRSAQGRRTIFFKSEAELAIQVGFYQTEDEISDSNYVEPDVVGWIQVDYLLANAEI